MSWKGEPGNAAKPGVVGHLTNLVVYDRLPDGVLEELRRLEPVDAESGRRKNKFHQHLTPSIGQDHLQKHLLVLVSFMRVSRSWAAFVQMVTENWPKPNDQLKMFDLNTWEPPEA